MSEQPKQPVEIQPNPLLAERRQPSDLDEIEVVQSIPIREAGFYEYWLQGQISDNPACLGLGELDSIAKERQQASGGRWISS